MRLKSLSHVSRCSETRKPRLLAVGDRAIYQHKPFVELLRSFALAAPGEARARATASERANGVQVRVPRPSLTRSKCS